MKKITVILFVLSVSLFSCTSKKEKAEAQVKEIFLAKDDSLSNLETVLTERITVLENYAKEYPTDSLTAQSLFTAAAYYRALHKPEKAIEIYKKVYTDYPNFDKHADCLFFQGFVLKEELNNIPEAQKVYTEFLEKYPDHEMAFSVKQLLHTINLSDEETIQAFMKGKKE